MNKRRAVEVRDYWEIFLRRRWWVIIPSVLIAGGTIAGVSLWPKTYVSHTSILVEPQMVPSDFVKPTVNTDVTNRLHIISQEIQSRTKLQPIIDQFGLYQNYPILDRFMDALNDPTLDRFENVLLNKRKRAPDEIVDAMRKDIIIEPMTDEQGRIRELGAFNIFYHYQGNDPAVVQQVAGKLAENFIRENVNVREAEAGETSRFIDDELEKARLSLEEQERRRKVFKAAHMGTLPEQEAANLQLLAQLQAELQVNGDALARIQSQKNYEESMLKAITAREAEPLVSYEKSVLEARREQLKQAEAKYTPLHPDVIRLQEEVEELEQSVSSPDKPAANVPAGAPPTDMTPVQIGGQITALDDEIKRRTQRETEKEKRIRQMQARVEVLPAVEQQMSELDRDYEISKMNYASLLEKKNASAMASEMERRAEGGQIRVLDLANFPEKPEKPDVPQLSLLGVLGGILCGCALGLFVEFQDRSIRSAQDASFYFSMPALASLPLLNHSAAKKTGARRLAGASGGTMGLSLKGEEKAKSPTVLNAIPTAAEGYTPIFKDVTWSSAPEGLAVARHQADDQGDAYTKEQFRMIRTRLVELMRVRPIRTVMVTSAMQGEGKTWVSANLAMSMSSLQNLRVLLVDADLRGAGLGRFLGVNPRAGLSDYLTNGRNLNGVRIRLGNNLSVVPTIAVSEGSAELLSGKRMDDFLEEALGEHDLVVLDAPPVLALADAQVLTAMVDAVIVVVRVGSSSYDQVRSAIELLKPKTVGVVVNGVARLPVKSYYYGSREKSKRAQ